MVASFEPLAGVLRVHPQGGDWNERSGYTFSCAVAIVNSELHLMGVTRAPTRAEVRAIRDWVLASGVKWVQYEIKGRVVRREVR